MRTAIGLAPENRYVLRCFTRLFAHYDEFDYAHEVVRSKDITRRDPWLISAEIALAMVREKDSQFVKHGLQMLASNHFSPFSMTELASSLATLEFVDGSRTKSKRLFKVALRSPNDNSLAQVEWALARDHLFTLNQTDYEVKKNHEALALNSFSNESWQKTVEHAETWFLDMPFSKRPIMLGAHVASVMLDDYASAAKFSQAGLLSHPNDPQLLNNLAYALALANKPDKALAEIEKTRGQEIEPKSKICLTATEGLAYFRKGEIERGRNLYKEAIDSAGTLGDDSFLAHALLNYVREEILIAREIPEALMNRIERLNFSSKEAGLRILRERVLALSKLKSIA
jgi:tetratricopeptide (TPR) repeat protein